MNKRCKLGKGNVLKETSHQGKLENLLENFTAIFGVMNYIFIKKTKDFENFATNHSIENILL